MKRREFLRHAGAFSVGLAAGPLLRMLPRAASGDPRAPNVLLLMLDQHHYGALSLLGHPLVRTPNLDRLACEGAFFEQACAPAPYCSPSRASLATGLYPHTHGVTLNADAESETLQGAGTPLTEMLLFDRRFATFHRGKWHLGEKDAFPCYSQSPDETASEYFTRLDARLPLATAPAGPPENALLGRQITLSPAIEAGRREFLRRAAGREVSERQREAFGAQFLIGRSTVPPELTWEELITSEVSDLIVANVGRPWMITCSLVPPHAPWVVPDPYYSLVDRARVRLPDNLDVLPERQRDCQGALLGSLLGKDGMREYLAVYAGLVTMMDVFLGRVLDWLAATGQAGRTLVIYTSDHGDMQGRHGVVGKEVPAFYDDLVRVPLILRLPGEIRPGTVIRDPVNLADLAPTILDVAGVPRPAPMQGRSLRPLLGGQPLEGPRFSFAERANPGQTETARMIRSPEWKYTWSTSGESELFDLLADPEENRSLLDDGGQRDRARELHGELRGWMTRTNDALVARMPKDPFA